MRGLWIPFWLGPLALLLTSGGAQALGITINEVLYDAVGLTPLGGTPDRAPRASLPGAPPSSSPSAPWGCAWTPRRAQPFGFAFR